MLRWRGPRARRPRRRSRRARPICSWRAGAADHEGYAAGAPTLKRALSAFRGEAISQDDGIRWLWLACRTAMTVGRRDLDVLVGPHVELARDAGALTVLPIALDPLARMHLFAGELAAAASLVEEGEAVSEATGNAASCLTPRCRSPPGRAAKPRPSELIEAPHEEAVRRGEGQGARRHSMGDRSALQRPRPLRGGAGRGAAGRASTHTGLGYRTGGWPS